MTQIYHLSTVELTTYSAVYCWQHCSNLSRHLEKGNCYRCLSQVIVGRDLIEKHNQKHEYTWISQVSESYYMSSNTVNPFEGITFDPRVFKTERRWPLSCNASPWRQLVQIAPYLSYMVSNSSPQYKPLTQNFFSRKERAGRRVRIDKSNARGMPPGDINICIWIMHNNRFFDPELGHCEL